MSSLRRLTVGAILATAATGAGAQDLAHLARRLDSVGAAATAARESLDAYRRTARTRGPQWDDSAVIADRRVKIYFNRSMTDKARASIAEADAQLRQLGTVRSLLPVLHFSIVPDTALTPYDRTAKVNVRFHPTPATANRNSSLDDPPSIAYVIVRRVSEAAMKHAGRSLIAWRADPLPLDPRDWARTDWPVIRMEVVSSPSPLGRRCYAYDLRACRAFLGLDSTADPLMTWYDAAGRRALVAANRALADRAASITASRCAEGSDTACVKVLRLMNVGTIAPAANSVRTSLVTEAMSAGGEGAAERLVTARGTAGEALAAAARIPLDTLMQQWQAKMRERGAASNTLTVPILLSSIITILVCVVLVARSSRWR